MYTSHQLPMDVVTASTHLGKSEIAYRLGYCFGESVKRRAMPINDWELDQIAQNKIGYGEPNAFIAGFHKSQATNHESR